ncbi:RHS repeat-associated core domain-containing protein [Pseudomonas sp. RtIB026]|uniref:RHS repeat-associated core domain-containing protein n=1 Tax=Pseudomonas sp. RtIB026 TaxID=2749999 RepID=UPI00194565C9
MSSPATRLLASDLARSVLRGASHGFAYSAYGYDAVRESPCLRLGFNGVMRDPQAGVYLLGNGYRAYRTVLMRFCSPDRLSPFATGGINAYAYCEGDPVNHTDPEGSRRLSTLRNETFPVLARTERALRIAQQLPNAANPPRLTMTFPATIGEGISDTHQGRINEVQNAGSNLMSAANQLVNTPSQQSLRTWEVQLDNYERLRMTLINDLQNEASALRDMQTEILLPPNQAD